MNAIEVLAMVAGWLNNDTVDTSALADALAENGHDGAAEKLRAMAKHRKQSGFQEGWTELDQLRAMCEGYGLFSTLDPEAGHEVWMIMRDDDRELFPDDEVAMAHVVRQARNGDTTAFKAVFLHGRATSYPLWENMLPTTITYSSGQYQDWLESLGGVIEEDQGCRGNIHGEVHARFPLGRVLWRFNRYGTISAVRSERNGEDPVDQPSIEEAAAAVICE